MNVVLRALLVALCAILACADVRLVEPLADEESAISVQIQALDEESSLYQVDAQLRTGMDQRGRPKDLSDPALYVEGTLVLPTATSMPGVWAYRWQESGVPNGTRGDSLRLTFPVVAGSASGAYSITVAVPRRDGPANIDWTQGDDLVLRVAPLSRATTGRIEHWRLELRTTCSGNDTSPPRLSLDGVGAYPQLRIPAQWLETFEGASLSACFQAVSSLSLVGSPYPGFVTVFARVRWRIRVLTPA